MNLDEYQKAAGRTSDKTGSHDNRLLIGALGIAGEAGEVADLVKKWVGHGHYRDVDVLVKELGDVLWYVAEIASLHDVSLSEVAQRNIEKLKKRYPQGFTQQASRARSADAL